ncbi:MAG TPA: hypothetical protein VFS05_08395, partial [Gemmatimonadaceae bacterium]|nr:hypothetical protein [Gemmatimonadaceae bacterium]
MSISLASVLPMAAAPTKYKLHLACWNQKEHPLDVFVRDREQWDGWNRWRGNRNDFTRPYILSFMDFYHEPDTWLFGGTYRVLSRSASEYNIELEAESQAFIGRLKVSLKRPARAKAF